MEWSDKSTVNADDKVEVAAQYWGQSRVSLVKVQVSSLPLFFFYECALSRGRTLLMGEPYYLSRKRHDKNSYMSKS